MQPARHSKLEKADILEMTVKHLEGLRSESVGSPDRFRAGYRHCVSEVSKYQGLEAGLKRRLVRHLEACVNTQGRPAGAPTPPSDNEDVQPPSQHSTIFISGTYVLRIHYVCDIMFLLLYLLVRHCILILLVSTYLMLNVLQEAFLFFLN